MKITEFKLRNIIRTVIKESRINWDEKIKKAKPYIASDAGLYYSLQQAGHPFSVAHYSLEPIRTRDQIMVLLDEDPDLQGCKVVGEISNNTPGYITYLLRELPSYDYVVLHIDNSTNSGVIASGFGQEFSMLKSIVKYINRNDSNNTELDQYISQF